jgi:hypothetical protein
VVMLALRKKCNTPPVLLSGLTASLLNLFFQFEKRKKEIKGIFPEKGGQETHPI